MFSASDPVMIWEAIYEAIRQTDELSSTALEFWFKNIKIVVIEDGVVAKAGSHDELMARKGLYYTLYTTQAQEQGMEV